MSKSLIFVKLGFGFGEGEGPEQKTSGGRGKGARREEDHEDQERHRFSFPWRPGGSEQKFPHDEEGEKKKEGLLARAAAGWGTGTTQLVRARHLVRP